MTKRLTKNTDTPPWSLENDQKIKMKLEIIIQPT